METEFENLTWYDVLQVERDASADDIRSSYRRLMQTAGNHPDRGGDARKAAIINKAYAVLCDPESRREYDAHFRIIDLVATGFQFHDDPRMPEEVAREAENLCIFCRQPHGCVDINDEESACAQCGSPVTAVARQLFETVDHRAMHRIGKSMGLRFYTHWPQKQPFGGRTEDVSLTGLRMVSRTQVQVGQRIRIVSTLLHAVGTVVHTRTRHNNWRREHVSGVEFETLRLVRLSGGFLSRTA